ncbi:transcription elongation factor GreA [Sediminivirga luteola]|uniref:transcription elongation factor GreA n=1 Tax=Sediminivirga luteola TaxID=1774748 RepID=UPI001F573AAF|nr:transcription elongation factor GreA [Sediminivirga luteola]MCI2267043.1 transcription elongation factor GreA [Sediminivirga luteola]
MTDTPTEDATWLSQEAYDRLSKELEYLTGQGRVDIAAKIEAAREEGDLKENGGYHAAREEQGKQEARIRQLEHLLRHAKVGDAPTDTDKVALGTVVEAEVAGKKLRFLLGSREIAGDSDLTVYSEKSPLGAAIMGLKVGESASYEAPNGKEIAVKVLKVEPFKG